MPLHKNNVQSFARVPAVGLSVPHYYLSFPESISIRRGKLLQSAAAPAWGLSVIFAPWYKSQIYLLRCRHEINAIHPGANGITLRIRR